MVKLPRDFGYKFTDPDGVRVPLPREEPQACPYCGRIMSKREAAEQGACNDCCEPFDPQ